MANYKAGTASLVDLNARGLRPTPGRERDTEWFRSVRHFGAAIGKVGRT